jgi:hypothetical protein
MAMSDVDRLVATEEIRRLKYAYLRCLDQKTFDLLEDVFTEDATASYSGGKYHHEGRDQIISWLKDKMGSEGMLSSHRCSHPEIELLSDTEATGVWALHDVVAETTFGVLISGAAFYEDRYVKLDGRWRIAETGYKRSFELMQPLDAAHVTASWWATDGQSSIDA